MMAAVAPKDQARDLEADLAICEAATMGPWGLNPQYDLLLDAQGRTIGFLESKADRDFASAARAGWPYAIRRVIEAEKEIDRLRNELNILQEHDRGCFD